LRKIYFRTSAGGKEGWGNIFRLLTIYQILKKKEKFNNLFIFQGNNFVSKHLKSNNIRNIKLKNKVSLIDEEKILKKIGNSDITIMEMLDCNFYRQKIYKKYTKKLIVFDDILKNKYCSDKLICAQYTKKKIKNINFYSGYNYFPIRKDFANFQNKNKKINKKIKKILVCLGGSAYKGANMKLLKYFLKKKYYVTFILGDENKTNFKNLKLPKNINFKYKIKNLSKYIFNSDLVISGGGYVKIESAHLGTPMITLPVQKHQLELVKNFKLKFNVSYLDFHSKLKYKLVDKLIAKYTYKFRLKLRKKFNLTFKKKRINKNITNLILN